MAKLTMAKAVRQNCIECSGKNKQEVEKCELTDCPLWNWRFGRAVSVHMARRNKRRARLSRGDECGNMEPDEGLQEHELALMIEKGG